MAIRVKCQCAYETDVADEAAGSFVKCPRCGKNIPIPATTQTEAPAACEACHHVERKFKWHPGSTCPKCGSDRFLPMVVQEGAYDYAMADRSKGPANEDRRLGQLARWAGLININQLNQALKIIRDTASAGTKPKPIGDVFVEEKLLTQQQLGGLLKALSAPRKDEDERKFCAVAISNKFAPADKTEECLKLQEQLIGNGRQAPFVGFLLMEKKYMPDHQVMAILKAQQRHGKGLLAELMTAIEEKPPEEEEKVVAAASGGRSSWWKTSPLVAIVAVGVILVSFTRLGKEFSGPEIKYYPIDIMCESCKAHYKAIVKTPPPYKCEKCGQMTAYQALKCLDCGEIFPSKPKPIPEEYKKAMEGKGGTPPAMPPGIGWFEPPTCPKCKSYKIGPVDMQMPGKGEPGKGGPEEKKVAPAESESKAK